MKDGRIQRFWNSLLDQKVALIGVGVSHTSLIKQMVGRGVHCTLCDRRDRTELGALADELEALGVGLDLGPAYLDRLLDYDVIFRTPGMYYYNEQLTAARKAGRVVTSELEVFLDLCPCRKVGITGSDGKTTTTTLIGEMLKAQGHTVHVGGNIGKPLLVELDSIRPEDWAVVELSSFQLISMRQAVDLAVVTNVTPNHLDVHRDMDEYVQAKHNLLLHQNAFSRTVLGADNPITAAMAPLVRGDLRHFSRVGAVWRGAFLDEEGYLCAVDGAGPVRVMHRSDIRIPGVHNIENYLAALAALWGVVSPEVMLRVAREFGGVEHRIELVRELHGVRWYNDSIASSPTRTIAGLNSFPQKVILIAGGYDKKIPFLPLAPKIIEKVKYLILMGDTAAKIEDTVTSFAGYSAASLPIYRADGMEHAVRLACELAREGDIVTLSPACASFDHYKNFELRGRHFKELVRALECEDAKEE